MSDGVYGRLGVRTVINAAGTLTRLGGSLMPPEVTDAMVEASRHHVRLDELQARAGEIIAEVTGAQDGYVTSGAAAGLLLAAAASMAGSDPALISRLPDTTGMRDEIVVQNAQRNAYEHALRAAGARLVSIGYPDETMAWELESAIGPATAAVAYWAEGPPGELPLETVVDIAHRHDVPVIVDAAAALPPVEHLRDFITEGADLVVFSGGKALRGPQASGIVAGRRDLVRSIALQHLDMDIRQHLWTGHFAPTEGRPYHGIGRALKVGKEEIVGCLTALRCYVERDHQAELQVLHDRCRELADPLDDIPGLHATCGIAVQGGAIPVVTVSVAAPLSAARLVSLLGEGEPSICVGDAPVARGAFVLNPSCLRADEPAVVVGRIKELVAG